MKKCMIDLVFHTIYPVFCAVMCNFLYSEMFKYAVPLPVCILFTIRCVTYCIRCSSMVCHFLYSSGCVTSCMCIVHDVSLTVFDVVQWYVTSCIVQGVSLPVCVLFTMCHLLYSM